MTLDELRQALVEQSGHTGLVTDAEGADYSDKSGLLTNATYYLNSGLRWLNRLWGTPGQARFYETTLAQGDWALQVPNLRHARHVYIHDGTTRYRLLYRPLSWLKKMYDEPFDNVDEDRPRYWSRGDGMWETEPVDAVEHLTNGEFDADLSGWDGTLYWEWNAGGYAVSLDTGISGLYQNVPGSLEGLVLSFDAVIPPAATLTVKTGVGVGAVTVATITATGSYSYTLTASNIDGVLFTTTTTSGVQIDNVSLVTPAVEGVKADIITMPPADQDYTLKVYGDFRTTDLSADADDNWWTEQHPEFVIRAARIMLELDGHRNISGLEAFKGMCEEDVARLAAEHRFAYISGFTPEEAARYG